jgi:hypothetical protein
MRETDAREKCAREKGEKNTFSFAWIIKEIEAIDKICLGPTSFSISP